MQLKKLGSALILATTAARFIIPDNTTDGVYAVRRLDDGTEEHIRVGGLPSQAEIEAFRARRRGGARFAIRGAALSPPPTSYPSPRLIAAAGAVPTGTNLEMNASEDGEKIVRNLLVSGSRIS